MFVRRTALATLLSIPLLLACSSSGGDPVARTAPEDLTLTPSGTDRPGRLLVRTPPQAQLGPSAFRASWSWDTSRYDPLPLDVTLSPIAVGNACFKLLDKYGVASHCVTIEPDKTTTYDLGAVRYAGPEAYTIGVDAITWTATDGGDGRYVDDRQDVVRPPGTYHLSFGLFDGIDVEVKGGELVLADLASLAKRRAVHIVSPARELPDAPNCGAWVLTGMNASGVPKQAALAYPLPGREYRVAEYDRGAVGRYTLQVGATTMDLSLSANPGDPATGPVRPARIDVDDVAVSLGDGSTVTRRGSYRIEKLSGELVCAARTRTGVDVAPGTYRILVTYDTAEAGMKTDVQVVTVN